MKGTPISEDGNQIEVSTEHGFSYVEYRDRNEVYMLGEHYKNFIGNSMKNEIGNIVFVENEYAIVFLNFANRIGKFLTEEEFTNDYEIRLASEPDRPGFVKSKIMPKVLARQMYVKFAIVNEENEGVSGNPGDYLIVNMLNDDYKICPPHMFFQKFKIV